MSKARQLADLGNVYDDGALSNRNLIINGAMQVAQRGTSTAITSSSVYTLDRFEVRLGGSYTVGATVTQESDGPDGFANCLKVDITSTSTPATSNNFLIDYKPESQDMVHLNWGSSNGKYLTLSFWVKSNKTGLYGLGILHDGKTKNWLSSYSISAADTWEYKTILIDPDTASAFDDNNGSSLRINWHLSDGPDDLTAAHSWEADGNYQSVTGAVNLCDSTSNYWQITGVQLEVGDTATPFEHRSYGDELARCERYFQRSWHTAANSGNSSTYPGTVTGRAADTGALDVHVQFRTQLRSAPTFTFYRAGVAGNLYNVDTAGTVSSVNLSQSWFDANGINGFLATGGPFTAGTRYGFDYDMDAEL